MSKTIRKPVLEQIYDSWEWKLREKLQDSNDVVCRIYKEAMQFDVKPEAYEEFMKGKLSHLLKGLTNT